MYQKLVKSFENFHGSRLPHKRLPGAIYDIVITTFDRRTLSPTARNIILPALRFWNERRICLFVTVVMPDHVHAIFQPLQIDERNYWDPGTIVHSIKAHTTRTINRHENTLGRTLWQPDFYNRIIRDEQELFNRSNYILNNPVRAALSDKPENYPWLWIR